eukprot:TRINITY_DN2128_c1_g2_i1.p2 TRINITY_DN2128_c1_g2~~TRINITY_DN2128_c1_g2_i1.p2  ORF type:complete len:843 (+),score=375.28 TRINITY_DN2128_c1_g2_i1:72-2600(+)
MQGQLADAAAGARGDLGPVSGGGGEEDEDRRFTADCIAVLRELDRNAREQRRVWDEVGELTGDVDSVALQVELVGDCKNHQLMHARERAAALARSIAAAAKVAEDSSRRVKELDQLKGRVDATLELAAGVTAQRDSLASIERALHAHDLEAAAEHVEAYFQTEALLSKVVALESSDGGVPVAEDDPEDGELVHVSQRGEVGGTTRALEQKREEVRAEARREFSSAAQRRDRDGVMRFSRLFPRLGIAKEGSELYATWLRQGLGAQLAEHVETTLEKIQQGGDPAQSHLSLVSQVLDHVVSCIEAEEEHVRSCFGAEGVKAAIVAIHQECTTHSVNVLNAFLSDRQLTGGKGPAPARMFAGLKPQQMDQTLEEIAHLSHYCHLYFNFLHERLQEESAPEGGGRHMEMAQLLASSAFGSSKLFDKLQELLAIYVPLQREYFQVAFEQASALAAAAAAAEATRTAAAAARGTSPPPGGVDGRSPRGGAGSWLALGAHVSDATKVMERGLGDATKAVSAGLGLAQEEEADDTNSIGMTLVEDVFFVLRVSVSRVTHTKNSGIICSVVNLINDVIRDQLIPTVSKNVVIKKGDQVPWVPRRVLSWVNAAHSAKTYTRKLAEEFQALCKKHFANAPSEMAKFLEQAHDIELSAQAVGDKLDSWTRSVAKVVARKMTEAGLVTFSELPYVLTQEMLLHYEINDAWVRDAIAAWEIILQRYHDTLNRSSFDDLVVAIVELITKQIEEIIMKKQFDLCGGLQVDKDVRAVKQYFSDKTERPVRERFTRLSHITSLLILDRAQEVDDLWSGGGMGAGGALMWRLTPQEALAVLALRTDFTKQELQRLRLART